MEPKRFGGNGRFSRVVVHNGTIYLCGLVGDAKDDAKGQTKAILDAIDALLAEHGSDRRHLLTALIHLTDIRDFTAINEVWDAWVEKGYEPTRTCVESRLADPRKLIEITVTAAVKE